MRLPGQYPNGEGRPTCYSCFRPKSHCQCATIETFEAHCNLLILQHPHERRKYYGTAKIAAKAISNSKLLRGIQFAPGEIESAIAHKKPYLLYPGKDASDCESVILDQDNIVIVIDGTWDEAGKIVYRNPLLKTLPKISFKNNFRSNYKIRKQPKDNYLSTIESIGHMLSLNAGQCGLETNLPNYNLLFKYFTEMVDTQLKHLPRGHLPQDHLKLNLTGSN